MKYTTTKITTTTTTTGGGRGKSSSQAPQNQKQKQKQGDQFSIVQSFSSQKPSSNFKDNLFQTNDESLYSSKQEVQDYQIQKIPKFLREKKKVFYQF